MANPVPKPPGHTVFGRRRILRSLAPADGVLGLPAVICDPTTATPNRLTVNMTASIA